MTPTASTQKPAPPRALRTLASSSGSTRRRPASRTDRLVREVWVVVERAEAARSVASRRKRAVDFSERIHTRVPNAFRQLGGDAYADEYANIDDQAWWGNVWRRAGELQLQSALAGIAQMERSGDPTGFQTAICSAAEAITDFEEAAEHYLRAQRTYQYIRRENWELQLHWRDTTP